MNKVNNSESQRLESLRTQFSSSKESVEARLQGKRGKSQNFMLARMLLFGLAVTGFVLTAWQGDDFWGWALMIPALLAFVLTVFLHRPVKKRIARDERLLSILTAKLSRLGSPTSRPLIHELPTDRTAEGFFPTHVLKDLGVFGDRMNLLSLLWTGSSSLGFKRLFRALQTPLTDTDAIANHQESVAALSQQQTLRFALEQDFRTCMARPRTGEVTELLQPGVDMSDAPPLWLLRIMTAGIVGAIILAFVLSIGWLFLVAVAIAGFGNYRYRQALSDSADFRNRLSDGGMLFNLIETVAARLPQGDNSSAGLGQIRRDLLAFLEQDSRTFSLRRARGYLGALSAYKAGLVYVFLSWPTFYDLHFTLPLSSWWHHKKGSVKAALDALADLEFLICMATLKEEQAGYCLPQLKRDAKTPYLLIAQGRHPFLEYEQAVPNSIELGQDYGTALITGSNMSGKSTYIKTCGLNLILAQIGAPICGEEMTWTPLKILTDINVKDSLDDGRSYFAVEVDRIREVLAQADSDPFQLALLDEMFRGTNTHEKVAAGIEVTRWLAKLKTLSIVATHDHEFTELQTADPDLGIRNFHFSEEIDEGGMVFSYRLKDGPAQTRNALKLLEISGYPSELVKLAFERSKTNDQ